MNMSKVLSGDALSGFKRWQVPDVTGGDERDFAAGNNKYLTAVQLERIQKQAYDEAYARGLREGTAAGQAKVREQAGIFAGLANSLQEPLKQTDERIENEIVQMCLAIARQIIRREITLDPGHIVSVIREALAALPASSQKIRISLHPDDAVLVRKLMAELNEDASWSVIDDITLSRGGCKVVTETSRIDASLEARIAMIASKILVDERSNDKSE
jgi:flagellar assembly protein FliH